MSYFPLLNSLISFLEANFSCQKCRRTINKNGDEKHPLPVEVFGIATGLNFNCSCGAWDSLLPDVVPDAQEKVVKIPDGEPYTNRVNAGDLQLNRRLVMGLQLCGAGRHDGSILSGVLNLNVMAMRKDGRRSRRRLGKT
jgi:hypothetical protein